MSDVKGLAAKLDQFSKDCVLLDDQMPTLRETHLGQYAAVFKGELTIAASMSDLKVKFGDDFRHVALRMIAVKKTLILPCFDPDLPPESERNREAAQARGLRYSLRKRSYVDAEGSLVRDQFGQSY